MEVVKDIAAVLGVILSAASILALVSKTARASIAKVFRKYGEADKVEANTDMIAEIKTLLEKHIEEDKGFKESIVENNEINLEFTRTQCRNIIKNIFYRYNDTRVLPLYEKKTLMSIEELYVKRLHGNSFASLLLDEMREWDVDYESTHADEHD